jgi:5-(carboxyamino)imidazole ribonucleotide mutase
MADSIDVAILLGSASDWPIVEGAAQTLAEFGVTHEVRVLSAHRTPDETAAYVRARDAAGTRVFIAAAGMAAHLAGAVAAQTVRPVLGIPLAGGELSGLDALLSTVQMPPGVPVATLGIGKAGATNAALLAIAILALERPELREKLLAARQKRAAQTLETHLGPDKP